MKPSPAALIQAARRLTAGVSASNLPQAPEAVRVIHLLADALEESQGVLALLMAECARHSEAVSQLQARLGEDPEAQESPR